MTKAYRRVALATGLFTAVCAGSAAQAATVSFAGLVVNLCVLTLATPGTLGMSTDGKSLSSDTGGLAATLTVAATGSRPTLDFGAPQLTGPSPSTAGASTAIAYSSLSGQSQAFTTGTSSIVLNRLIDSLTVRGRATNDDGFVSGTYGIAATVTCQQ